MRQQLYTALVICLLLTGLCFVRADERSRKTPPDEVDSDTLDVVVHIHDDGTVTSPPADIDELIALRKEEMENNGEILYFTGNPPDENVPEAELARYSGMADDGTGVDADVVTDLPLIITTAAESTDSDDIISSMPTGGRAGKRGDDDEHDPTLTADIITSTGRSKGRDHGNSAAYGKDGKESWVFGPKGDHRRERDFHHRHKKDYGPHTGHYYGQGGTSPHGAHHFPKYSGHPYYGSHSDKKGKDKDFKDKDKKDKDPSPYVPPPKGDCPEFYGVVAGGATYSVTRDTFSWEEANELCHKCLNSRLANFNNAAVKVVTSTEGPLSDGEYWIGSYDGGEFTEFMVLQAPSITARPGDQLKRRFVCD